ncbi:MAG: hypothetical protein U0R19_10040 [Bryobacteraceae bacterium]
MKYLLCQIGLTALLFAQSPWTEAKQKALCDAMQKGHTYLQDEAAESYLQSLVNRMENVTIRIVDETEPWADYRPCRVVLVTKGFLQNAASERALAETIAHMAAHSVQAQIVTGGQIPIYFHSHHPRALVPGAVQAQVQEREEEAERRSTEMLAAFAADPDSRQLKAFQQRYPLPVRKKPTLYR